MLDSLRVTGYHVVMVIDRRSPKQEINMFEFDGQTYTLASMLEVNMDDEELCDWLRRAQPSWYFPAIGGGVRCVACPAT